MRYLIETKGKEMEIGAQIARWQKKGELNIIEKGDPVELIKTELIKVSKALETLDKLGINQDVLVAYLRVKCSGVPVGHIHTILYKQNEFFRKMGLKK